MTKATKPPTKPTLSKAGTGLNKPSDLSRKEVRSLSGRVLSEAAQKAKRK